MSQVTKILAAVEAGDERAAAELLPIVYDELRQLARARLAKEPSGNTLQATDLVHEAYRRLVQEPEADRWNSVGHFFGAAAEAMRRILIDRARARSAQKRGGDRLRIDWGDFEHPAAQRPEELLELDAALTKLAQQHAGHADLVKLRFFAGLTIQQAADVLDISCSTADRIWAYSRAWLKTEIAQARNA